MMIREERKLITVASGKGGVGKTWLSVTLGHYLAGRGRRVLLFDGDLGLANVDIQLGLTPRRDLGDVLSGEASIAEALTPITVGIDEPGRFEVLAGKSGSGALGGLNAAALIALRQDLIEAAVDYDHVLLDLAAGIEPSVAILSQHRGTVLVVLSPDPTSLTDAYAYIKLLHQRRPDADIRIVVNMAKSKREGERTYEALRKVCRTFLRHDPPLAAVVRLDPRVRDAIRQQTPLLARHPQCDALDGIERLAQHFLKPAPAEAH